MILLASSDCRREALVLVQGQWSVLVAQRYSRCSVSAESFNVGTRSQGEYLASGRRVGGLPSPFEHKRPLSWIPLHAIKPRADVLAGDSSIDTALLFACCRLSSWPLTLFQLLYDTKVYCTGADQWVIEFKLVHWGRHE